MDQQLVARKPTKRTRSSSQSFRTFGRRSLDAHRQWLLDQHGPVCAYCGLETKAASITLDHVYPRKGQKAYDRPDNLVLACRECNATKADTSFVGFIAQRRSRGVFLLHYGEHLSEPVKELVRKSSERDLLSPEDDRSQFRGIGYRRGRR